MKTCAAKDLMSTVEISVPVWFLPQNYHTERCSVMMQNALAQSVFFFKCISAVIPELEGSGFINSFFDVEAY
jgi:spore maturation protein CgeB